MKRDLSIEKLATAVEKTEIMKALQVVSGPDGQEVSIIKLFIYIQNASKMFMFSVL